jgi:hypothetical protein
MGAPDINANVVESDDNGYQFITCRVSVFHHNDEHGLNLYLGTVKNLEIVHFIPDSMREKLKQILNVSRYSAIIVFIVMFSHESIPSSIKKEFGIGDLLMTMGFSLLGAIPTLFIDTFIAWKEHHN